MATNQKSKNNFCSFGHGELTAKKWLDFMEKQRRRSNVCYKQTDRQTELTTKK